MDYVRTQLGRRPENILIIAHSKFTDRARAIKSEFPLIRVATKDDVHSKVLMIAPGTVVVSSANFGSSHWHETSLSVHSKEAHDWYVDNVFSKLWDQCTEIPAPGGQLTGGNPSRSGR
jgi:hypothetical protein